MATQTGEYYPNTVGFPIRFTLEDLTESEITEIESESLTVRRPDGSTFTRDLTPGDITDNYVEYTLQDGDCPAGGLYHYSLVLAMTNSRSLPLLGSFEIHDTDVRTDETHAARTLALLEAAIEGRIPAGLSMTIINGQNITRIPLEQLCKLRDQYRAEVRAEQDAARTASGLPSRRNIYTKFVCVR
jgi:hypothetical protein